MTDTPTTTSAPTPLLRASACSARFVELVPRDFARDHLVISQGRDDDGCERIAIAETTPPWIVHNLSVRLGCAVETILAEGEAIARVIDEAYEQHGLKSLQSSDAAGNGESALTDVDAMLRQADRDLLATEGKAPVVRLVDGLLFEALGLDASDVHIQPMTDRTLVRYRVDGMLHDVHEIPHHLTNAVISRIKVMGRMDIAERRIPQDGRAGVTIGSRPIDLRISTLPTSHGERTVIRLLDNSQRLCEFDDLGMPKDVAKRFLECATRSNGIILVTGPTGSGKTTTLYATLRRIANEFTNLMTIEDPIEYELSTVGLAISQSQVNNKKGVTFASGLRHILRQDPDVIMVGEIRDAETARIAIQSSLTGHLVFSTLHTNDAASAVTRLIDLGIEPYLVSASLSAVLAQRLVRLIHQACDGNGCEECLGTGLKGRTGIFELLVVDERVRALIGDRASSAEVLAAAEEAGTRSMTTVGRALVASKTTTEHELRRVVSTA